MMQDKSRIIIDTNLLVSRILTPDSVTASAVRTMIDHCHLLVSQATMDEISFVLTRIQNKGYIRQEEVAQLMQAYQKVVEWVPIIEHVQVCRDPRDDKFLELAVNGRAEYIVTGDDDLLVLKSFGDTKILSTKEFIEILMMVRS